MVEAQRQEVEIRRPPKVTPIQWGLALMSLALAGLGYYGVGDGLGDLVNIANILLMVNALLVINVGIEAVRTRVFGKFFLISSTLVFFWIDGFDLAHESPPFKINDTLPFVGSQFSRSLIQQAFLYVAAFQFMLFVGYSISLQSRRLVSAAISRVDSGGLPSTVIIVALAACAWVPLILTHGGIGPSFDALVASRSEAFSGRDIGLIHFLLFFGMFGASLLLVKALALRSRHRVLPLIIGGIAVLPFILLGTRHLWLFVFLPVCLIVFSDIPKGPTAVRVMRWGGVALVFLLVLQLQFVLRGDGWDKLSTVNTEDLTNTATTGQFTALVVAEALVPERHDYFLEPAEPFFLVHWVPRQFWAGKPIMKSWSWYNDAYRQGARLSVTPSIIGQYHINWGPIGVLIIGAWLGFLALMADKVAVALDPQRQRAPFVALGMFYAFLISSFRFYSPIYFLYFVIAAIGTILVTRTVKKVRTVSNVGLATKGNSSLS